jgi:hypothetical protein
MILYILEMISQEKNENFAIDNVLGFNAERNEFNEFVFEFNLVTNRNFYVDSVTKDRREIKGYYFFRINDHLLSKQIYDNCWHEVPFESYQFYRMIFENNKGENEFFLDLKPIEPVFNRDDIVKNSLIVKINAEELKHNVDYIYDRK